MHMLWCGIHFLQKVWTRSSIHKSHYQHEFVLWKKKSTTSCMHLVSTKLSSPQLIQSISEVDPLYTYHDHNFKCIYWFIGFDIFVENVKVKVKFVCRNSLTTESTFLQLDIYSKADSLFFPRSMKTENNFKTVFLWKLHIHIIPVWLIFSLH